MKADANTYFRQRIAVDKAIESIQQNKKELNKKISTEELNFSELMLRVCGVLMDKQLYTKMPPAHNLSAEETALLIGEITKDSPELAEVPEERIINMILEISHRFGAKFDPAMPMFNDSFYDMIDKKFAVEKK